MSKITWNSPAETAFWAHRCRESFWWFARKCYNIDGNPRGGWLNARVHKPWCDWFEFHVKDWLAHRKQGIQKNLMILVPREFGKTTLITNAGLLWIALQDPELSVYVGSETLEKASEFLAPILTILDGSDPFQQFTTFYGNWYSKDRQWNRETIVHALRRNVSSRDPSFGTWGVATGLTGKHPDVLCMDDPISYEKMEKDSQWLQTVNDHVASLIPVLKGNGLRLFIGTRYAEGDWLGRQLQKHGAKTISGMPCPDVDARPDGVWDLFWYDSEDLQGNPTYPEVWPLWKLNEFKRENSLRYYAQQRNAPATGQHMPLSRAQIDRCFVARRDVPANLRCSIHIDTAFKGRERIARGDYNVIQVWGHARDGSGDVYYLEGYGSNTWRAEQFNDKLVTILQRLRREGRWPFVLTDELETAGKSGTWELTLESWCHQVGLPRPPFLALPRGSKKKVLRIIEAASYWADGHVKLVRDAPGLEPLVDQMLKIGVSSNDDWADAAADVFHKEVYKPMRLIQKNAESSNGPQFPFDSELKPFVYSEVRKQILRKGEYRSDDLIGQGDW